MNTSSDVARAAIGLIQRGWTNVEPAINAKGESCHCYGKDAVAWTLLGAIAGVPSDARIDKLKMQLIGRIKVFLPKNETMVTMNLSKEAALKWLAYGIQDGIQPT